MCGGFVGDIIEGVGDAVGDVVEFVGDTVGDAVEAVGDVVQAVIEDPLPAIIDIGLIAVGVPPVIAGAVGGAVGAAEHGGNILEGALVGGATGYVGGAAGEAALNAGWSMAGTGAAMGAAQGATGAVLTGGDIEKGILGGGLIGGAIGYVTAPDGSTTITYDDGSTLRTNPNGSVTATPATDMAAPVIDRSTYSPEAIAEANAAGKSVTTINAQGEQVTYKPNGDITVRATDGSVYTQTANGQTNWDYSSATAQPDQWGGIKDANGDITYHYDDGSTMTVKADGTYSSTPATDTGIVSVGNEQIFDDGSRLIDNGDGTYTAYDSEGNLYEPGSNPNLPKAPTEGTFGGSKGISWTLPAVKGLPLVPVLPNIPKTPTSGGGGGGGGGSYTTPAFGAIPGINTRQGLNPGYITEVPFYDTTDPSQAKYYWGSSPMQTGATFNPQLANTIPFAPKTAWGLQESFQPMTPEETAALVKAPAYTQQVPGLNQIVPRAVTSPAAIPQAPAIPAGDMIQASMPAMLETMPQNTPTFGLASEPMYQPGPLPEETLYPAIQAIPVAPQPVDLSQLTPEQLAAINDSYGAITGTASPIAPTMMVA